TLNGLNVHDNHQVGLLAQNASTDIVVGNGTSASRFSNNASTGVSVTTGARLRATGAQFSENGGEGVRVAAAASPANDDTFTDCTFGGTKNGGANPAGNALWGLSALGGSVTVGGVSTFSHNSGTGGLNFSSPGLLTIGGTATFTQNANIGLHIENGTANI